jgi:hypothetical protein
MGTQPLKKREKIYSNSPGNIYTKVEQSFGVWKNDYESNKSSVCETNRTKNIFRKMKQNWNILIHRGLKICLIPVEQQIGKI